MNSGRLRGHERNRPIEVLAVAPIWNEYEAASMMGVSTSSLRRWRDREIHRELWDKIEGRIVYFPARIRALADLAGSTEPEREVPAPTARKRGRPRKERRNEE